MNRPRHSLNRLAAGLTVIAAVFLLRASPASAAGSCAQDYFTAAGNSQTLNCSAKDIQITGASNPRNLDGSPLVNCVSTQQFNVLVDFTVVSQSDKTRSNVGLYLGTIPVGQTGSSALSGTCDDNILALPHNRLSPFTSPCTTGSVCLGDQNYTELDGAPATDNCGDAATKSTHIVTVELDGVVCPNVGTNAVILPDCTTWQVPGSTIACFSDPNAGWQFQPTSAIPGSPSKCHCGQVSIPITPINPTISATKTPNPATVTEPSGTSKYTVVVTNTTAGAVDVTINQLCDDKFGNIATATTSPAQNPCAAGTLCPAGSLPGSTCATSISCPLPATLAQTKTVTCTFDGTITGTEPGSVKDTVTANGVGAGAAVQATASATVTIGEAAAKAQVAKTLDNGQACAVARYKVKVDNISTTGTDETETLTGLMDNKFSSDLTQLSVSTANPKVVGTTCGVAAGFFGLGTMAQGQPGALQAGPSSTAGALPFQIGVGGSYICEFDGEFCSALGTAVCATGGLEDIDTVTAKLSLDSDGVCSGGTNDGNLCASNTDCPGTPAGTCVLTLSPQATLTVDSCFSHTP